MMHSCCDTASIQLFHTSTTGLRYTQFKRIECVEYSGNEAKIMVVADAKADMIYLSFHYNIIMTAFKTL